MFLLVVVAFIALSCAKGGIQKPDPKKAACEASCDEAFKECKEKAGDNAVELTACKMAKEKCLKECNK
jgi:hypothetical protein